MKILYVSFIDIGIKEMAGVHKKIGWQVKALRDLGLDVIHGFCHNNDYFFSDTKTVIKLPLIKNNLFRKRYSMYINIEEYISRVKPDVLYLRFAGSDPFFIKFLKKVKNNKNIKVILEVPTYPLINEFYSLVKMHWKNRQFKLLLSAIIKGFGRLISIRYLKKYVDKIVSYMSHDRVWKIPVITIDNGVYVEEIPIKKVTKNESGIVLIGVAAVSEWHGYDRIILGIHDYIKKDNEVNICFKIVGEGPALGSLKKLVKDFNLEKYVEFLGFQSGESLNKIFNNADVAVSSLGMHRIGLYEGSTLKTKEYCARGIPFIYAYKERELLNNTSFSLLLPANDSPIDMQKIIEFVDKTKQDKSINLKMRKFAFQKYDWKKQMEIVIKEIVHESGK